MSRLVKATANALSVAALALGSLVGVASLSGCGTTFAMTRDSSVPGARGNVDASFVKDGNNKMHIKVEHLPAATELNPQATTYVVWVTARTDKTDVKAQSVGTLKVDPKDEDGELEFTTPYKSFDLTITPEGSSDTTVPTGRVVLKATISSE